MSVTIKFDGVYCNTIRNVGPEDVVLEGKKLSVKGISIPITPTRLYDAFYALAEESWYKHGIVTLVILKNGELQISSNASDNAADYFLGRFFELGALPTPHRVRHRIDRVPGDEEYKTGLYVEHIV